MNKEKYGWSLYFQNPLYLEASRLMTLNNDLKDLLVKYLPCKENIKVLEVGCGNGLFTFFLDNILDNSQIIGIDNDQYFIQEANKKLDQKHKNEIEFLNADGCNIPFADNSFDLVISHTYLTSVSDPEVALNEKIRVTKSGAYVSSITCQTFSNNIFSFGNYPANHFNVIIQLNYYRNKIEHSYSQLIPEDEFRNTSVAERIPQLFGKTRLRNIEMHPIGIAFSLSDARISYEKKKKFINCFYEAEILRLKAYMELPRAEEYIPPLEAERFIKLLKEHQRFLYDYNGENTIWEWYGGANILMIGQKPVY